MAQQMEEERTRVGETWVAGMIVGLLVAVPMLKLSVGTAEPPVVDPDVWWHVRTGQWMAQQHTWPRLDEFSTTARGQPYRAYSWVAEVMLWALYRTWGLRGLVLFAGLLSVCVASALYGLVRRAQGRFLLAGVIVVGALVAVLGMMTPRPWLFSILCMVLELDLLLSAGRTGRHFRLLWLVPLFVFWANVHIQFVLGLGVLGLVVIESAITPLLSRRWTCLRGKCLRPHWAVGLLILCAAATLINPYGYHLHTTAVAVAAQTGPLKHMIVEFGAPDFASIEDWTTMGLALAATAALGRWGPRRLLWLGLLPVAVVLALHMRRDMWFLAVTSAALLADCLPAVPAPRERRWGAAVSAAAAMVLVWVAFVGMSEVRLQSAVNERYPQKAVAFLAAYPGGGRLFNPYNWGGYLILYLPQYAVSMDGRGDVHGSARIVSHCRTLDGQKWRSDPELSGADILMLPKQGPLSEILRLDARYRIVHEDDLAVVFVARREADADLRGGTADR